MIDATELMEQQRQDAYEQILHNIQRLEAFGVEYYWIEQSISYGSAELLDRHSLKAAEDRLEDCIRGEINNVFIDDGKHQGETVEFWDDLLTEMKEALLLSAGILDYNERIGAAKNFVEQVRVTRDALASAIRRDEHLAKTGEK